VGVRRAFIALTVGQLLALVSAYGTHVTLARLLGASDYGDYGIILNALSTASVFLTAGLPEAIAKVVAQRPALSSAFAHQALRLQARVALVLGVGYALLSPLLARVLKDPAIAGSMALSALSIPGVAIVAVAQGTLNGQRRFWAQALLVGGGAALRCAAVVTLTYFYRIPGAVMGLVVAPTVVGLATLPALKPHSEPGLVDPKELSQFARPVVVFTVALALLMNLDLFAVKAAGTSAEWIGLYAAAATVAKMPYLVLSALGVVLLPVLSSAGSENAAARATLRTAFRGLLLGSFLIAGTLVPLSSAILRTLYGATFVAAALPLALLLVSGTIFTLFFVISYAIYGVGNPKTPMKLTLFGLAVELVVLVPLIRWLGVTGAAAASVLTSTLLLVTSLLVARGPLGSITSLGTLLRAGLAFVLTVALGLELSNGTFFALLWSPLLAVANLAVLLVTRETSVRELASMLKRSPVPTGPPEAVEG
jgi:stage V sporulation protein B